MAKRSIKSEEFSVLLGEVKSRIQSARVSAARAVNRDLILLYWDIGRGIVDKQEALRWGKSVVETLSRDLKVELPALRGFSANNLWLMRQLYTEFASSEFLEQLAQEIGDQPSMALASSKRKTSRKSAKRFDSDRSSAICPKYGGRAIEAPQKWFHEQ